MKTNQETQQLAKNIEELTEKELPKFIKYLSNNRREEK
jgi:hypothetical protein